eukprot:CAMPEP_0170471612 /NCGR_PEP_ID=MMETSP0123-20130129/13789_1 /TAXON_ID=182087 /ORGANISM="Favella ehrenbergii, Strain Fehren 1" /LENGTH=79 /DNA_ID=CAMNT_0010739349 /DNA_START=155 /DNA_END=394 /DNA_ORIENTATION=-
MKEQLMQLDASEGDSDEDDNESDAEEVAITLAIIANTDLQYNEVADAWRVSAENERRAVLKRHDLRPINHRIIIDELPR